MAQYLIQPSFAAGELSPHLYARVDLAKYKVGAAKLLNCFVDYRGGISSRAGTSFVAMAGQSGDTPVRFIKFQFSILQTYVLEFGEKYMRIIRDGALVFKNGEPYVVSTPWAASDLALLKFAQSNDVMTFTHPSYPPYDIARELEDFWTITEVKFGDTAGAPNGVIATLSPAPTKPDTGFTYVVTTVDGSGLESLASRVAAQYGNAFSDRLQSITIAWASVTGSAYYNVYKANPFNTAVGGLQYPSGQQFGYIGTARGLSLVDNNILPNFSRTPPINRDPFAPSQIVSINITATGAGYTNDTLVDVLDPTGTGFVGKPLIVGDSLVGVDVVRGGRNYTNPQLVTSTGGGVVAQFVIGPSTGLNPGVVTYFQQRKIFAASARFPSTYWATQPGNFYNMDITLPVQDGNAFSFTLAALEQNPIKFIIPVQNGLIMLTGGAAWLVSGGSNNDAITPTSVRQTPQVYNGCADVQPLVIGTQVLYVQEKGYVVQDLTFNFFSNSYTGDDRTYYSSHLFRNRRVIEWTWAEQPSKLIWARMNDGRMLTMTYIKEQEVFGWAQHETKGQVKTLCAISEDDEDVLYLAVERPFGRTIERMVPRKPTSTLDAWGLDCAIRYQGGATSTIGGLLQGTGETVSVVADGIPYANLPVTNNTITLPQPASNVLVGYGYETEFQSLYVDVGEPTIQGKRKKISAVTLRLVESKAVLVGRRFSTLVPVKDDGTPTALNSRDMRQVMDNDWSTEGQVCLRGTHGMPWTLTALIPEVSGGDSNG